MHKLNQLIQARNELRSALANVQAVIDAHTASQTRAKRKGPKRTEARTPTRDPRVAVVREVVRGYFNNPPTIFNNLRKSGARCVKIWSVLSSAHANRLQSEIAARLPDATFVWRAAPRRVEGMYLCVILPAQK